MRLVSILSTLAIGTAILGATIVQGRAASPLCPALQSEYVALTRQAGGVGKLNGQLSKALAAAQNGNCNRLFAFFGPPKSPACPAIMATVGRLRHQIASARGESSGWFASSPEEDRARLRDTLVVNGCEIPSATGSNRTLCVRTCDGYYFPISNKTSSNRTKIDAAVCQSMYAEEGQAELYVQRSSDVGQSVSPTGKRYAAQPFAFRFRESYDAACQSQLKTGIAALAVRYLSAPAKAKDTRVSALDPTLIDGVEDLGFIPIEDESDAPAPVAPAPDLPVIPSDPDWPVRFVGASYYAELFNVDAPVQSRPERKRRLLSTAELVPPASD